MERADPVLRGRIESIPVGEPVVARGVDELAAAVRRRLVELEAALIGDAHPP